MGSESMRMAVMLAWALREKKGTAYMSLSRWNSQDGVNYSGNYNLYGGLLFRFSCRTIQT